MKIAAVQMRAELADVDANLKKAQGLVEDAFKDGAEWVILPEFFTSAVGFNRKLLKAAMPLEGLALTLLVSLAKKHGGAVGGSFIAWDGNDCYNTFVLAMPDGSTFYHRKDIPTMWENCYYMGGNDDGILDTPSGKIGAALCWEFVRTRTARRLRGKVSMVVGGSCWWTLPEKRLPGFPRRLHDENMEIMRRTIPRFARMLGVPVVHAAHAGELEGGLPLLPGFPYRSFYLGETQITDGDGRVLARMPREEGDGFVAAHINMEKQHQPSESIPDRFWIPDLPWQFKLIWFYQNRHGRRYYRSTTRPLMQKRFNM